MAARPTWRGHLSVSLVNFGVRLYNATSYSSKISFHFLHRDCGQRLKQQLVCPAHGPVNRATDVVKGYEYERDTYVVVEQEELKQLEAASSKTIQIDQFINADELHPMFLDRPYYVAPDGEVSQQGFRIIHEAMKRRQKTGIGRFVIHGTENIVSLDVEDEGFRLTTLRTAQEVKEAAEFFEDIERSKVDPKQLKLAEDLVDTITGPLDISKFRDEYQETVRELVEAKIKGEEPVIAPAPEPQTTYNFAEALKASLARAGKTTGKTAGQADSKKKTRRKPPAKSIKPSAAERKRKRA